MAYVICTLCCTGYIHEAGVNKLKRTHTGCTQV